MGYTAAADGQGSGTCDGKGESINVMIVDLCPAADSPYWCATAQTNQAGFNVHFDISSDGGLPGSGWSKC